MAVGIMLRGVRAEVRNGGKWICEDSHLERLLRSLDLPSGYYPGDWGVDWAMAGLAERELRAVIVWCEIPPKRDGVEADDMLREYGPEPSKEARR